MNRWSAFRWGLVAMGMCSDFIIVTICDYMQIAERIGYFTTISVSIFVVALVLAGIGEAYYAKKN